MKKIIMALVAVVVVAVIGIAALLALVDPNQFKPVIAEQVNKATGRDLVIDGDISWRFFPSIGFDIGKTELRNPPGFAEPNLAQFDQAELSVSVMPLFSQQLEIGNVSLQGGRVFIQTLENGVSNLDGLSGQAQSGADAEQPAAEPSTVETEQPAPQGEQPVWQISLAGVDINHASALIIDDQAGSQTEVQRFDFSLAKFAPGEWTAATFDIVGSAGELRFDAEGKTELLIAKALDGAEFKALSFKASAKDAVNDIRNANISLDSFKLGEWSTIEFSIEGQVPDLSFTTQGATQLMVDEAVKTIDLKAAKVSADVEGASLPRPELKIGLEADAKYYLEKGLAELPSLKATVDEVAVAGNASFQSADIPVIRFDLSSDNIDVDAFLGTGNESASSQQGEDPNQAGTVGASAGADSERDTDKEPDLSVLNTLDLAGKLAVGQFKAANAHMSDVTLAMTVKNGVFELSSLDAKLYQGTIHSTATIDATGKRPTYRVTNQIKGVQVQPLLVDVAQNDTLAGSGDITVNVLGTGLAEKRIRENIAGTVDIRFADGAIYGVNIPEMIREARATLKGQKAEYVKEEKKTDFSSMSSTINLGKGVASTNNLDIDSPLLRINGQGSTSLVNETIDFAVNTSVVATSKGQGGKDIDEVADLTVPIDVKGNWSEPTFSLNLAQLLKQNNELEQKAQREVERGLEKLLGDKAKDDDIKKAADKLLKGLFN
ncbi:AsmA family protein [Photobacterium gaetbulicola]|uniref:AsmA protein n=1 Tax=Photobacterium gaetbulicola Gung47 TaxID=658445 RepID=A0A0C5WCB3_9GAMM|nr:AsmA family protein [Photobacterium gaetbulicola]AJR09291.1 AsmA protein [Photobacterium gaetbulicola Gung47]PSU04002.1 AsmA family protein [Photobacterium gaetbulicola]